jgi:phosphate-selective porin OprO/OprP
MWLVALLAIAPAAKAESSALLQLLDVLRQNDTIAPEAYESLKALALADAEGKSESANREGGGMKVSVDGGGLEVESADGAFGFQLGGRIHVDGAWYSGEDLVFGDGTELRRVRLSWGGTLWEDWAFKGQVDLAGDEVSLKSTYITYSGLEPASIRVGSFKEPFSLERLTSSNSTTFMERAAPRVFAPSRNIGVGVGAHGEESAFLDAAWSANLGLFSQGENDGGPEEEGWAVTGRATLAPAFGKNRFVHLGAALSYRDFNDTDSLSFDGRPESHVTGVRLVDTDYIEELEDEILYGLEAAAVLGSFSLQGEYMATRLERDGPDLDFDGWYAYASWLVTGESRRYDARRGIFRGVKPKRNLGDGGIGAWELALRYSNVDLNDADVIGGEQDLLTAGLNWYPNPNIRFMVNWINVLDVDRPGSSLDGVEPEIFQVRAQVHF